MPLDSTDNDEWYRSEPSPGFEMISEVQRIRRRTRVHPIKVILLAALITGGLTYKLVTRRQLVEAEVVLALTEGSLSSKHTGIPVNELKEFVTGVLLPDQKLRDLIERRDLYRSRSKLGMQYAIDELRGQLVVEIWRNSFVYYDPDAPNQEHSARIGLTVSDGDPDRAFELARDLAAIVIETAREQRQEVSRQLANQTAALREALTRQLGELDQARAARLVELSKAQRDHKAGLAQSISLQLYELDAERKHAAGSLTNIAQSREGLADQIAEAGLDMQVQIVEEHRPDRPEHKNFVIALIAVIVGVGSLLGSALLIGAFDSRVHDVDDVERLGLPVLGHVPGFPGDHVGSLEARGASRARVPSFLRWRSHR